jgi:hypothetical protein
VALGLLSKERLLAVDVSAQSLADRPVLSKQLLTQKQKGLRH